MRMVVTAKSAEVYGKQLSRGTEFLVPVMEARLFDALGRARPARRATTTKAVTATAGADDEGERRGNGPRYNRRDMRAEG
jgi:hypothetical protein